MFARFISRIERRKLGGFAKIAGKDIRPISSKFKSRNIIRTKNDYLESRRKELGTTLDRIMADEVTEATGYVCTAQFVSRFRNKQVPKIQSAYALHRNNMQKQYAPNAVDLLMQKWGR